MEISVNNKSIILDSAQLSVYKSLQELEEKILTSKNQKKSLLNNLFYKSSSQNQTPQSLYIQGRVGRGKSMLMINFFHNLKIENKIYFHFNDFMQKLHRELHRLRKDSQHDKNLVANATKNIIGENILICLDEFQVDDVADAMILSQVFTYIFAKNIKVIFTSNSLPENLYPNGLQRNLFLKFVNEVLYKNCLIVNLDSEIDYRERFVQMVQKHYFFPINQNNKKEIDEIIFKITDGEKLYETEIEFLGRKLLIKKSYKNIAVFDFKELCEESLGVPDFQAIVKKFNIIFLLNIPKLNSENRNEVKRLILFIDEVYEHKIQLLVLSEVPFDKIYESGTLAETFKRTVSRLKEITSGYEISAF